MSEKKKGIFSGFSPFGFITGKIRNKLLVTLLAATAGTLIVAGVALYSMRTAQTTLEQVVDRYGRVANHLTIGHENVLMARDAAQKYMLNVTRLGFENARAEYAERLIDHFQTTHANMTQIRKIEAGNNEFIPKIDTIHNNVQTLKKAFADIVDLTEAKGLGTTGLIGELNNAGLEIEKLTDGQSQLQLLLLTVKSNEKEYLQNGGRRFIRNTREGTSDLRKAIMSSPLSPDSKKQALLALEKYMSTFDKIVETDRTIADNMRIYRSAMAIITPHMASLVEAQRALQNNAIENLRKQQQNALIIIGVVSALTILFGLFSAFFLSRRLTRQTDNIMEMFGNIGIGDFDARAEIISNDEIGEMAESLNAMLDNTLTLIQSRDERDAIQASIMSLLTEISDLADGDLTVRAKVTEEITGAIADSFNAMAEQLSRVVLDVKEASSQVGSSSKDVEQVTSRLAAHSEQQAAKIQEAITTIEEMAARIRQVSESAGKSAEVSEIALNSAREGSEAVRKTNNAMASIKENMRSTARTIKRLGESSQEIGNIVQIINDIADRTSILALNASIQAAEAGDAGRGFAVVAEEVQRLAERSATSTKQIETLISTIQGEIGEAGTSMERSIEYVVEGTDLADQAYSKLEEIESISNQLAEIIGNISSSARQQSVESENITAMMHEVGQITGQTTTATRETTASMEKITSTSEQLERSISVFKVADDAAAAA